LFKVVYGWGLRRREAAMLDVADFAVNPAAPELGRFGVCHVRYGKAVKGSPPRRRAVATVMPWAAEALEQYLEQVRPRYGCDRHPAVWLTGSPSSAGWPSCRRTYRCIACVTRMCRT
jgi:hypothetical protein